MEVGSSSIIIARMKDDYASVKPTPAANAKESYYQQDDALSTYAHEHQGIAMSARELDYGPAVQFPFSALGPLAANGAASTGSAMQAYSEGASIATKPEYGSLRLLKASERAAAQHTLNFPEEESDATLSAAAEALARDLQKAKDQEAVRADIVGIFSQYGVSERTLGQMDFDQRQDGSVAVTNHPLAAEVETLVNSDPELAGMMSFLFGFNSRSNVTA